jgi:hypothetical protein
MPACTASGGALALTHIYICIPQWAREKIEKHSFYASNLIAGVMTVIPSALKRFIGFGSQFYYSTIVQTHGNHFNELLY